MKVAISMTVEVDPQVWADEYGIDPSEVREDVRRWVVGSVQDGAAPVISVTDRGAA